ncbi:hypothetical protein HOY80DRAFT_949032 [Tuber brumale]|nr:hypothetical protein HOY80DRAFT_949032 [Tuber brumale]
MCPWRALGTAGTLSMPMHESGAETGNRFNVGLREDGFLAKIVRQFRWTDIFRYARGMFCNSLSWRT